MDRFIRRRGNGVPQGLIQRLLRQRRIKIGNSAITRNASRVYTGDVVEFPGDVKLISSRDMPTVGRISPHQAEYIRSRIIYSDQRCVVLNKPQGIPTQGGSGVGQHHLEALLSGIDDTRFWLVHRLDKEVSGTLLVARDIGAARIFGKSFRDHRVEKIYWALVVGKPPEDVGRIEIAIDGKGASTDYCVVQNLDSFGTWLALRPRTGRKHQLRIHCAFGIECPIVGDPRYGDQQAFRNDLNLPGMARPQGIADLLDNADRLHLHARSLSFAKLSTSHRANESHNTGDVVHVTAPLSDAMKHSWTQLGLISHHGDQVRFKKR